MAEVAVIIPAYNAERTLGRAIGSVRNQTFRDLEIVVVDDGSTDGTAALVERIAAEDLRVRLIRQANAKAYAARVNGVERTQSKYVAFLDADDAFEPTMIEKMVAAAEEHDLDIVQCEQVGSADEKHGLELLLGKEAVGREYVEPLLVEGRTALFVWDKLYNRRCLPERFERSTIMMGEDLRLNIQVLLNVARLGLLHEGLYHYDVNVGSSVSNFHPQSVSDLRELIDARARWLPRYGVDAADLRMAGWIAKNVRIYLTRAAWAKARSGDERVGNVRALLEIPELKPALDRLGHSHADALFLSVARLLPGALLVAGIRLLKRIQGIVRGRR